MDYPLSGHKIDETIFDSGLFKPFESGINETGLSTGPTKSALELRMPLYFAAKCSILGHTLRPIGGF
jgi:hypothetical protein